MVKEEPNIRPMATFGKIEVCNILGVSKGTVTKLVNNGFLIIGGINPISNRAFYFGKDIISCWKRYSYGK